MLTTNTVKTPKVDPVTTITKKQFLDLLSRSRDDSKNGRVRDMGAALEDIRARYHL